MTIQTHIKKRRSPDRIIDLNVHKSQYARSDSADIRRGEEELPVWDPRDRERMEPDRPGGGYLSQSKRNENYSKRRSVAFSTRHLMITVSNPVPDHQDIMTRKSDRRI